LTIKNQCGEVLDIIGAMLAVEEISGTWAVTETYYYLVPSPVTGLWRPFEMERLPNPATGFAGDRYWYEYDGSDSVASLVDESGNIVSSYLYNEYGFPLVTNWELQFFAFVGLGYDGETGLYSWIEGYYDSARGVYWLTRHQYRPIPLTDPISLLMGLLPLLSVISLNKRKRRGNLLLLTGVLVLAVILLVGCNGGASSPTSTSSTSSLTSPTPSPSTPHPPRPLTDWERSYGKNIARAAKGLLSSASSYYIWGANPHPGDEDYHDPPPRCAPKQGDEWWGGGHKIDLYQRTGGKIPIVCADVVAIAYKKGGLDLRTFTAWNNPQRFQNDPTRNVFALKILLADHNHLYEWREGKWVNGEKPQLGDIVMFGNLTHSGVVVEVFGDDPSQIFVVQASYSKGVINKMDLKTWGDGHFYFGHPDPDRR